jgi:hypothetical protein
MTERKAAKGAFPVIYDIVIAILLLLLGAAIVLMSRGNNALDIFGGSFIGAGLATLFTSLLTVRIERKIGESIDKFDQALALVQFEFDGSKVLDKNCLSLVYQYCKTRTGDGLVRWRLTLYEWSDIASSYIAKGTSTSVDISGHSNVYSAVMIAARGSLLTVETDVNSDEPSTINILHRGVATGRHYGVSRVTTWTGTNIYSPIIVSAAPIGDWKKPDQDEHSKLGHKLDKEWSAGVHAEFWVANPSA